MNTTDSTQQSSDPESSDPESPQPESSDPESSDPESPQPDFSKPDFSKPESPKPESPKPEAQSPRSDFPARPQTLYRPLDDRMLAGVAAGIARYLEVDVTLVRVILAVLAVVGGVGVPIYLAGWLLIPEEGATQSIASDLISSVENRRR